MSHQAETELPGYDPYLRSFHVAFAPELEAAIAGYQLTETARVLDVPCGDGFYSALFARHMRGGVLIAADSSAEYLACAKERVPVTATGLRVEFREVDVYAMPFDAGSIDFVWCAQSMISLADPVAALREMRRVLRPGGQVGVLETDEFHHVVLPWPVKLELALHQAVRDACKRDYGDGAKFAQSRKIRTAFVDAGLTPGLKRTLVADRQAPFGAAERDFLKQHLTHTRKRIAPELSAEEFTEFDQFADPDAADGLFNSPETEMTVLASVHHAGT